MTDFPEGYVVGRGLGLGEGELARIVGVGHAITGVYQKRPAGRQLILVTAFRGGSE